MTLPRPDPIAQVHSQQLIAAIHHKIQEAGGVISFANYMNQALYAPGLGYYSAGAHKIGKEGDFVTAPEISPLFAQTIAHSFRQVLESLNSADILELGAGSGVLAKDLLLTLEKWDLLPQNYFILEVSGQLRARQHQLLQDFCPHLLNRVVWLDTLPENLTGIIVANEVLDAMPVHLFKIEESEIFERGVTWQNNAFAWHCLPASAELAKPTALLQKEYGLGEGYCSEINLSINGFMHSLAQTLSNGVILLLDYGYDRREYYRPDRVNGTLMCFYRHHYHEDPFAYPGLQDITAHVDFTGVAEAGIAAGLSFKGYTTQAGFLLDCGLLHLATEGCSAREQYAQTQAIKTLTLPSQMGELVKVMGFAKNYPEPVRGFSLQDRRRDL